MAEPKTKVNSASVSGFLDRIPERQVREDCRTIARIMQDASGAKPEMWGSNIVGFGRYRTHYADGKEAHWMLTGFSPRKQNITLYIMDGLDRHGDLMSKLGTHSCGKSCLYIKKLSDVHLPTLKKLVNASVKQRIKSQAQREVS